MKAIGGLFIPLRGKISTKTDVPDGIELGVKKMKKFVRMILLAAIAMTMCLSSCTKKPEKLIVGKWKVVSARCSDNNVKPWVIEAIGNDKGETWTFKENGTFVGFMNVLSSIS